MNVVREKSYVFALASIRVAKLLRTKGEFDLGRQLLRSATSVGANIEEAQAGSSRADFIAKMSIASKEARESHYWLRLIRDSRSLRSEEVAQDLELADELIHLLTAIVKTTRSTKNPLQNSKFNIQNS